MQEREQIDYETLSDLRMEYDDIENLYHMSIRNPSLEAYGFCGESLSVMCLDNLATLNPDKYKEEFISRALKIYLDESTDNHLNTWMRSPISRLDYIYASDDNSCYLSEVPTELLQDAYYTTLDNISNLDKENNYQLNAILILYDGAVDWYESLEYHLDLCLAGQELMRRGYNSKDVDYYALLNIYHIFLGFAATKATDNTIREQAYVMLKNEYGRGIDDNYLNIIFEGNEVDEIIDDMEDGFVYLVGRSTPSISIDILANLIETYPENKQYKKLAKRYIRDYGSLFAFSKGKFNELTDLGKEAYKKLGGRDATEQILAILSSASYPEKLVD